MRLIKKILQRSRSGDPQPEKTTEQIRSDFDELLKDVGKLSLQKRFQMLHQMNKQIIKAAKPLIELARVDETHGILIRDRFKEFQGIKN